MAFVDSSGEQYGELSELGPKLSTLLALSVRGNTSAVKSSDEMGAVTYLGGNATERAMLQFVASMPEEPFSLLSQIPFRSETKYSLATIETQGQTFTLLKGAPERLLNHCTQCYHKDGSVQPLTSEAQRMLSSRMDALASRRSEARRVGKEC